MTLELDFASEEELREIIDFYFDAKELVAFAELDDEEQRLCIPAIVELRNALDHLMRIGHVCVNTGRDGTNSGLVDDDDPRPQVPDNESDRQKYCEINFSKIKGHLFRAAYDALDVLVLSALREFRDVVRNYDFDDICSIIVDWPTQAARVEAAQRLVKSCKMYKDVVGDKETREDVNREVVEKYLTAYRDIKEATRSIQKNSLEIRSAVRARKKETRKTVLISLLVSISAAIVIAIGVWLSRFLPSPTVLPNPTKIHQEEKLQSLPIRPVKSPKDPHDE